jgi:hypothetical protein
MRRVAWLAALTVLGLPAAAQACDATPVRGGAVKAGPFKGLVVPEHDVVDGGFRLHVGAYRDREAGLSQKIPWIVPRRFGPGQRLTVRWRRLDGNGRFTVRLRGVSPSSERRQVFPSSFSPPQEGCWRLRFRSGDARGSLTVLVRDRG